jgi:hypothetical protein
VAITGLKALSLSRGVYTPKVEGTQHSHKNLGLDRLIPKQKNVSTNASIDRQPFFFLVKINENFKNKSLALSKKLITS